MDKMTDDCKYAFECCFSSSGQFNPLKSARFFTFTPVFKELDLNFGGLITQINTSSIIVCRGILGCWETSNLHVF